MYAVPKLTMFVIGVVVIIGVRARRYADTTGCLTISECLQWVSSAKAGVPQRLVRCANRTPDTGSAVRRRYHCATLVN